MDLMDRDDDEDYDDFEKEPSLNESRDSGRVTDRASSKHSAGGGRHTDKHSEKHSKMSMTPDIEKESIKLSQHKSSNLGEMDRSLGKVSGSGKHSFRRKVVVN